MNGGQVPNSVVPAATALVPPRRLLLLSCSKAKTTHDGLVPAIQRYDGPAFRVLRRYLSQRPEEAVCVYILSAEFGLIPSDQAIPQYDRRMTVDRARALRPQVRSVLDRLLSHDRTRREGSADLLIVVGKDYLPALLDLTDPKAKLLQGRVARGSQGGKLAVLHDWLHGAPPTRVRPANMPGLPLRFQGVEVAINRDGVLEVARRALRERSERATDITSWTIPVDGQGVAPKWLVSQVTGVPVSRFTTSSALSLLARLGIEAERA